MKGVVFVGNRQVALEAFPDPEPGPGEAIIEIKASGMCGTDLHAYRAAAGHYPHVIGGHEPAGIVAALGPGSEAIVAKLGARVMVHHYAGCATCEHCHGGWPQMCTSVPIEVFGQNANGAHAPFLKVPVSSLIALDDSLSFSAGATLGCGTGTAWGALKRLQLSGRDTIAIFGQGPVGLSATMLAAAQGARVIALDISQQRLDRASAFGAYATINPLDGDVLEKIHALTRGKGVEKSLETSAAADAVEPALRCVRPWGCAAFVGIGGKVTFDVAGMLRSQITVMTSLSMSIMDQQHCADFIIDRELNIDSLFTDHYRIEDAAAAYADFDRQTGGKGVFLF